MIFVISYLQFYSPAQNLACFHILGDMWFSPIVSNIMRIPIWYDLMECKYCFVFRLYNACFFFAIPTSKHIAHFEFILLKWVHLTELVLIEKYFGAWNFGGNLFWVVGSEHESGYSIQLSSKSSKCHGIASSISIQYNWNSYKDSKNVINLIYIGP